MSDTINLGIMDFIGNTSSDFIRTIANYHTNGTYGRIDVEVDFSIALYHMPVNGPKWMWESIAAHTIGLIFIIPGTQPELFENISDTLSLFKTYGSIPTSIMVVDRPIATLSDADLSQYLNLSADYLIDDCDIQDKESSKQALLNVVYKILDELEDRTKPSS